MVEVSEDAYLEHYGILRRSGRYPWGSGGWSENSGKDGKGKYPWSHHPTVIKRSMAFIDWLFNMRGSGMSEVQIAESVNLSVAELRDANTIARNEKRAELIAQVTRMRTEKQMSTNAIAKRLDISEGTVRNLLRPGEEERARKLSILTETLREEVAQNQYIDVGKGVGPSMHVSKERLRAAIGVLKDEGYVVHEVKEARMGTGRESSRLVLAKPGTEWKEVAQNKDKIHVMGTKTIDAGDSFVTVKQPISLDSKRIEVRYADESGGSEADGTIFIRRGVDDISIGANRYAQVRVMVDGSHYMKGMAVYKDDLPDGVDVVYNTNKTRTGNKLDAMKKLERDPVTGEVDKIAPFKTTVHQEMDSKGNVKSVMNMVGHAQGYGEEGSWDDWSRNLPSQFLSKQSESLIKKQLDKAYDERVERFEKIQSLTNPTVKRKLMEAFSDETDSSAVYLKAAAMPKQRTKVILPVKSLKDHEVYAPDFDNGDQIALVRFPHGGLFEIPVLTVNNKNSEAKKMMGNAQDAIGINSNVAQVLSGADFDGDTVLAIKNNDGRIKSKKPLKDLEGFEPTRAYPPYDGMKTIDGGTYNAKTKEATFSKAKAGNVKQTQMGVVSNLITDMTIRGAPDSEIARAVRHSMVVIDSEKHMLNWKQSEIDNGIADLKAKYQTPYRDTGRAGASTIISRAKQKVEVLERRPARKSTDGIGPIDPRTGKKRTEPTGATTTRFDKKTGTWVETPKTQKVYRMLEIDDARTLSSGTKKEAYYADHANRMKALANEARKETLRIKDRPYSPAMAKVYDAEVKALADKVRRAEAGAPLERRAQTVADYLYKARKQAANDYLDDDAIRRLKYQSLREARARVGADKVDIVLSDREWEAIQAGAVSAHRLKDIMRYSNMDRIQELAMPKRKVLMTGTKINRAKAMLAGGATQAEVARALGVSLTTLKDSLNS